MNYGEENLNDLYLLIYKISDHIQRPVKILTQRRQIPIFNSSFKSLYLYMSLIKQKNKLRYKMRRYELTWVLVNFCTS